MYRLLILLMATTALNQFGMTFLNLVNCQSRACAKQIETRSRDVLKIDWKPISVWPGEAKRFK